MVNCQFTLARSINNGFLGTTTHDICVHQVKAGGWIKTFVFSAT